VRNTRRGARARAGWAAAAATVIALAMSGCTATPEEDADPLNTAAADLRVQLEEIDGLADLGLVLSGNEVSVQFSVASPAVAERVTLDAIEAFHASDVPDATAEEVAEHYSGAKFVLHIVEPDSHGAGSELDMPLPETEAAPAVARAVAAWSEMGQVAGVSLHQGDFDGAGFSMRYSVVYDGLLAGLRPTAATPQLQQIIAGHGFDPAASAIAPSITAPQVLNAGKERPLVGTRLPHSDEPLKAVAGPNYGSTLYSLTGNENFVIDAVLLPKLAADGTLLPLDLTAESVLAARPAVADELGTLGTLRNVIVFTQDGSVVY